MKNKLKNYSIFFESASLFLIFSFLFLRVALNIEYHPDESTYLYSTDWFSNGMSTGIFQSLFLNIPLLTLHSISAVRNFLGLSLAASACFFYAGLRNYSIDFKKSFFSVVISFFSTTAIIVGIRARPEMITLILISLIFFSSSLRSGLVRPILFGLALIASLYCHAMTMITVVFFGFIIAVFSALISKKHHREPFHLNEWLIVSIISIIGLIVDIKYRGSAFKELGSASAPGPVSIIHSMNEYLITVAVENMPSLEKLQRALQTRFYFTPISLSPLLGVLTVLLCSLRSKASFLLGGIPCLIYFCLVKKTGYFNYVHLGAFCIPALVLGLGFYDFKRRNLISIAIFATCTVIFAFTLIFYHDSVQRGKAVYFTKLESRYLQLIPKFCKNGFAVLSYKYAPLTTLPESRLSQVFITNSLFPEFRELLKSKPASCVLIDSFDFQDSSNQEMQKFIRSLIQNKKMRLIDKVQLPIYEKQNVNLSTVKKESWGDLYIRDHRGYFLEFYSNQF